MRSLRGQETTKAGETPAFVVICWPAPERLAKTGVLRGTLAMRKGNLGARRRRRALSLLICFSSRPMRAIQLQLLLQPPHGQHMEP